MPDATRISLYRELDPAKKDIKWADMEVSQMRRDWMQIVNPVRGTENRRILLSTHSMEKVKQGFKDKSFRELTEFIPIAVWENIRNILTSEIVNYPPKVRLKAVDPSAMQERKDDITMLKNRRFIEGALTQMQGRIGYPPYKLPKDSYNSNVDEFDQMGMNDQDPDDLHFFYKVYQRLNYETHGQALINEIMRLSKTDEWLKNCVMDILAIKMCCYQIYVSNLTGEIKLRHLFPEICYGILGKNSDGSDDICKGWQDAVTIREWIEFAGNDFDWDRDWQELLWALNYCNGTYYTGFIRNGIRYDTCLNHEDDGLQNHQGDPGAWGPRLGTNGVESNCCEWTLAYTYKVYMGYMEWMSMDADTYKQSKITQQVFPVPYHYRLGERSSYEKVTFYNQTVYKTYFLATSVSTQFLFNYGKLYFQRTEGQYEELAMGSLIFYREEGLSAVDISKAYLGLAEKAFYRMYWAVDKAKPRADVYWLDELIQIAKAFDKEGANNGIPQAGRNMQNILTNLIQYEHENLVKVRTYPKPDGKTHLNPAPTNDIKENGLDPIAIAMQTVCTWAEQQIVTKTLGMNNMRMGMNPNSKDLVGTNEQSTAGSMNASGYVYRMISYVMNHCATISTLYAQDILHFPDTIPYKWLTRIIGDDSVNAIELLGKFAAHKYGIFAQVFNSSKEREEIKAWTTVALQKDQITIEEMMLINGIEDPEKAGYMLAYFKQKARRREMQKIQQEQQFQMQLSQQQHQQALQLIQTKLQGEFQIEQLKAQALVQAAQLGYQGKVDVKQMQIEAEPAKQAARTDGQKEVQQNKENLSQQRAYNQAVV